jgi:glycosyltransferase involved in cell wall biosynthesis
MSNKKTVLLIAPQPFFAQRGTPINVRAITRALVEGGYAPTLLVFPFGEAIRLEGVEIVRTFRPPWIKGVSIGFSLAKIVLDICLFFSAAKLVFSRRFAVLHGIEEGAFIAGILGLLRRIPYIVDLDSNMAQQMKAARFPFSMLPQAFYDGVEGFFLKRASLAIPVCRALSEKVRMLAPHLPMVQIEDIPVTEVLRLRPGNTPAELKKDLAAPGQKLLVYIGNFEEYQGLDILIDGFARFAELYHSGRRADAGVGMLPLKLIIIGGNAAAVDARRQNIAAAGLAESIQLLGEQPINEIPAYEKCADLLISPRKYGTNTPLKLYSYMSSGVPILATAIESHTQILDDSSAFLFEPDAGSLGQLLLQLVTEEGILAGSGGKKSARAKEIVEKDYSWAAFSGKVKAAYRQVIPE